VGTLSPCLGLHPYRCSDTTGIESAACVIKEAGRGDILRRSLYVTMLTAVFAFLFSFSFLRAVATTKVIDISSSLAADAIFAIR